MNESFTNDTSLMSSLGSIKATVVGLESIRTLHFYTHRFIWNQRCMRGISTLQAHQVIHPQLNPPVSFSAALPAR